MKKFVFSLHALLEVKEAQKEKLQAEFAAAKAELERTIAHKAALEQKCAEESKVFEANIKVGITAADLETWAMYFEELENRLVQADRDVNRAQEAAEYRQAVLVEIHREIKALEKLRHKQHLAYLAEEKKRETDAREDILAFRTCGETARPGSAGAAR